MKEHDLQQVTDLVIRAVTQRLGSADPDVLEVVAREVVSAVSGSNAVPAPSTPPPPLSGSSSSAQDNGDGTITTGRGAVLPSPEATGQGTLDLCSRCLSQAQHRENAVVTTTGKNTKGVVAAISAQIAQAGGDIQDLSQTIVADYFTMIMVVDISQLQVPFSQFKERLLAAAQELGIHAVVMHEDVMRALQRV